jgi:hypothetical protein
MSWVCDHECVISPPAGHRQCGHDWLPDIHASHLHRHVQQRLSDGVSVTTPHLAILTSSTCLALPLHTNTFAIMISSTCLAPPLHTTTTTITLLSQHFVSTRSHSMRPLMQSLLPDHNSFVLAYMILILSPASTHRRYNQYIVPNYPASTFDAWTAGAYDTVVSVQTCRTKWIVCLL